MNPEETGSTVMSMLDDIEDKNEENLDDSPFHIIVGEQTPKANKMTEPANVWFKVNRLLILEFVEFAKTMDHALGIAANQVSWNGNRLMDRFFVHRLGKKPDDPFKVVIDPVIVTKHGAPIQELEGCLCWPGRTVLAQRHLKITVSYWTINENELDLVRIENEELDRFDSQVWQHEMDHLDGVKENVKEIGSTFVRQIAKVGRNDKCPCGSGIKYKKCCGK